METEDAGARRWNAGGWFGAQIGATLWLGIYACVVMGKDWLTALVSLGAFLALNAWGAWLWSVRHRLTLHSAVQRFLGAGAMAVAALAVVANERGASVPPAPGEMVSTFMPYWVVAVFPALMFVFWLRERML